MFMLHRKSRDSAPSPTCSPRQRLALNRPKTGTKSKGDQQKSNLTLDRPKLHKSGKSLIRRKTLFDCPTCGHRSCKCKFETQLKLVDNFIRTSQGNSGVPTPSLKGARQSLKAVHQEEDSSLSEKSQESEEVDLSEPSSDSEESEEAKQESLTEADLRSQVAVLSTVSAGSSAPQPGKTFLIQPLFEGRPATVVFDYPPQCFASSRINARCFEMSEADKLCKKLYFKVSERSHAYNCILNSFKYAGIEQTSSHKFNIIISKVPKPSSLRWLSSYQRFNHFPGSWNLGRKDNLWRNVCRMRRTFGSEYEICPPTYILSDDYARFQTDKDAADPTALWILKPSASSCGRGIKVISKKSKVKKKSGYIVSKYISNPHTLNGFKYDLRIYVVVTSFNPLRVYLYNDGLTRFATETYSSSSKTISKRYIHLTNYSVNRKAPSFKPNSDANLDNDGSKWALRAWAKKMNENGVDVESLMGRIKDIIIKTLISVESQVLNKLASATLHRDVCFELYGFDILIDSSLRPWLLEVNVGPSLSSGAPIDKRIKTSLMCDLYTLVGIAPYNRKQHEKLEEIKRHNRLIRTERRMPLHTSVQTIMSCRSLDEIALSQSEINVLMELEEETHRKGNFRRIFPKKTNFEKYAQYFEADRLYNWVTWKYLKEPSSVLVSYVRRGIKALCV